MKSLVILLALSLLLAACAATVPLPALDGTEEAPDITLPTPDGETLSLADLRGQVVFVNFWATYCPPCVAEMPDLQKAYETLEDENFVILGVNVEEHPDVVKAFVEENGITFPIVISDDGTINPTFDLRVMPTTWFIDADGIFRGRIEGQMNTTTAVRIAHSLLDESQ